MRDRRQLVRLKAKSANGEVLIKRHTDKWEFRGEVERMRYIRREGPFVVLRSLDGTKIVFAKKSDDPDFEFWML